MMALILDFLRIVLRAIKRLTIRLLVPNVRARTNHRRLAAWTIWRLLLFGALFLLPSALNLSIPVIANILLPPRATKPPLLLPALSLVDTASTFVPISVDVVFVHGLGSFPDTTWRKKKDISNTSWVKDMLPEDLMVARLLYYNYDSTYYNDAPQKQLEDFGADLLSAFNKTTLRSTEEEQNRPIIFVCHSYGGLVLKAALVQAMDNPILNQQVLDNVKGAIFLGTPHFGTKYIKYVHGLVMKLDQLSSNPDILLPLAPGSAHLLELHKRFLDGFVNIDIINIWETRGQVLFRVPIIRTPYRATIVPRLSATFYAANTVNDNIDTDHSGLNKYNSRREQGYITILNHLKNLVRKIEQIKQIERKQQRPLVLPTTQPELLNVTSRSCISTNTFIVKPRKTTTYIERPSLITKLEAALNKASSHRDTVKTVALWGIAGGGKTELALQYAASHSGRYDPIIFINAETMNTVEDGFRDAFHRLKLEIPLWVMDDTRKSLQKDDPKALKRSDWFIDVVLEELTKHQTHRCEWLLILDNIGNRTANWIQRMIPAGGQGSVILTSVNDAVTKLDINHHIQVDMLERNEAKSLLLRRVTLHDPENQRASRMDDILAKQDEAVAGILDQIGNHAIVVEKAGDYIAQRAVVRDNMSLYLDHFHAASFDINLELDDEERNLATVLEMSWQLLNSSNPLAVGVLALLANLNGPSIEDRLFREGSIRASSISDHSWFYNIMLATVALLGMAGTTYAPRYLIRQYYLGWNYAPLTVPRTRNERFAGYFLLVLPFLIGTVYFVLLLILRDYRITTGQTVLPQSSLFHLESVIELTRVVLEVIAAVLAKEFYFLEDNKLLYAASLAGLPLARIAYAFGIPWVLEIKNTGLQIQIKELLLRLEFPQGAFAELSKIVSGIQRERLIASGWRFALGSIWRILWVYVGKVFILLASFAVGSPYYWLLAKFIQWMGWDSLGERDRPVQQQDQQTSFSPQGWVDYILHRVLCILVFIFLFIVFFLPFLISVWAFWGINDWDPFHFQQSLDVIIPEQPLKPLHGKPFDLVDSIADVTLSNMLEAYTDGTWNQQKYSSLMGHISRFSLVNRNEDASYSIQPLVRWWILRRLTVAEQQAWLEQAEYLISHAYYSSGCWSDYTCQRILIPHLLQLGSHGAVVAEDKFSLLRSMMSKLYRSLRLIQDRDRQIVLK